ncbi:hypothetical protein KUTeg_011768 [Tegillarca granosa]|uniref:THAP-type domain-containing protein n=1 Tax=Tegillarca granosa TaxID=220873 RepID=A0ABQ9EXM8_TEGGR|nr:hypothetical protein KUTeg_011768 [Tegillarca granosa]
MGGHDHCAIFGCNHRRDKNNNGCSFFEFPKQVILKSAWIRASGRQDLKNVKYAKVCGCHFVSGKPDRRNRDSIDAVPTVGLPKKHKHVGKSRKTSTSTKSREWTEIVSKAEKEGIITSSVSKRSKRKLNYDEVPSVANEIEISSESDPIMIISFCSLNKIIYGFSLFIHRKIFYQVQRFLWCLIRKKVLCWIVLTTVMRVKPPPRIILQDQATQTDNEPNQTTSTSSVPPSNHQLEMLNVKLKHFEQLTNSLKLKLKEKEKQNPPFNHKLIKDDKTAMFWTVLRAKGQKPQIF